MKFKAFFAAAGLAVAAMSMTGTAEARDRWDDRRGGHHDRWDRHDRHDRCAGNCPKALRRALAGLSPAEAAAAR